MKEKKISLLFPNGEQEFKMLNEIAVHDLGINFIVEKITDKFDEQQLFSQFLSKMTSNPQVAKYRIEIFDDIYKNPEISSKLLEVLEHINYEKQYSGFSGHYEQTNSAWELLHRLEEINDYIKSVEAIHDCLKDSDFESEGIKNLKSYIDELYSENGFAELKNDIYNLKTSTQDLKSITVGINLNEKFEAHGIGVISFNNKYFTKSNVIGEFCTKIATKDSINDSTDWNDDFKFRPLNASNVDIFEQIVSMAKVNDSTAKNSTFYMDKIANTLISNIVQKLKKVLNKYVYIPVTNITDLIPEFIFYIKFSNYIKSMQQKGFKFCKAEVENSNIHFMNSKGLYNFKLLSAFSDSFGPEQIVSNDLDFSDEHLVYILTGANRGGKTTITQAVGLLFVIAQAGIYVPAESFKFYPVDAILSHFPADEDKTMDLGRLGEECKRFKEIYKQSTEKSLLLLNETYSTTSFEEGYFIAKDSVRAILQKGIRTIYNTHMHKLAFDIPEINKETEKNKAESLVVKSKNGERSFKVEICPPEGVSFAKDIAEKYGVTYEMLTE